MAGPKVQEISFSPVVAPWQLFLPKLHTESVESAGPGGFAPAMSPDLEVAVLMCCSVC